MFTGGNNSHQRRGVEQVGNSEHVQTAHSSLDFTAVLQQADRKCSTIQQVELDVPLRQSLWGHIEGTDYQHAVQDTDVGRLFL